MQRFFLAWLIVLWGCWLSPKVLFGLPANDSVRVQHIQTQIAQLEAQKQYLGAASAYDSLAKIYEKMYGFNKFSIESLQKSLEYYHLVADSVQYYRVCIKLADFYLQDVFLRKQYSIFYYQKAISFFAKRPGYLTELMNCYTGIGDCELNSQDLNRAVFWFNKALPLSQQLRDKVTQGRILNLFANYYLLSLQYDQARSFADRSLALSPNEWVQALDWFYKGLSYKYEHRYQEAIVELLRAEAIALPIRLNNVLQSVRFHLSECYEALGQDKAAIEAMRSSRQGVLNFYDSELTRNIRLAEANSQMKQLSLEKTIVEKQQQNQRILLLAALLAIALLGVASYGFWRNSQQQRQIATQQQLIFQKQEQESRTLALIEGQEQERTRIARELHDGLGAMLSGIKLFVETHWQSPEPKVQQLGELIDNACQETRHISNNLRPFSLLHYSLQEAIVQLVRQTQAVSNTPILYFNYVEHLPFDDNQAATLYRIIQELLNNAVKYAHASEITVEILPNGNDGILLQVEDDGQGFDPSKANAGNGLRNVANRVAYLAGSIEVQSAIGRGTSVQIRVKKP